MGRVYIGDNPCSGCGKTGIEARRHYKDGICWNCLDDLKKFRDIEKRTEGRSDKLVKFRIIRHEIPYITSSSDYENLIKSIEELLIKLDVPDGDNVATEKLYYGSYHSPSFSIERKFQGVSSTGESFYCSHGDFTIREDIAIQVYTLMQAVENFAKTAYSKGKQDGSDLLQSLAVERIKPSDFYEEVKRSR